MNKAAFILICVIQLLLIEFLSAAAKNSTIDSMKGRLTKVTDTLKVKTLIEIGDAYDDKNNYENALPYYLDALKLAETIQNKESLFLSLTALTHFYENLGRHEQALEFGLRARKIAEEQGNRQNLYEILDEIGGIIYFNERKYDKAIECGEKMMKIVKEGGDKKKYIYMLRWFGDVYRAQRAYNKAIEIYTRAQHASEEIGDKDDIYACIDGIGLIYDEQANYKVALKYHLEAFNGAIRYNINPANNEMFLSQTYFNLKNYREALNYAGKSLDIYKKEGNINAELDLYSILVDVYTATNNYKEAYNALSQYTALNNSINSAEKQNSLNLLQAGYEADKQTKAIEFLQKQESLQAKLKYVLIGASVLLLFVVFLVANKYRLEKRSQVALSQKNNELNNAIKELKQTQTQLIQSEKMASLGELTAGIAHEIQNPLNFVNNFSDVNSEMIEELEGELKSGNIAEALAIAGDIKANEKKINHHGKRADSIVKGMLQHSKTGSGSKEPTNINTLADEYMRLAYHGLRAKDKSFNAEMTTHFDPGLPKINVLQQDMGRVMLNLFNNAFYAVNQKQKTADADYKPEVTVTTGTANGRVIINVKDNGTGIPEASKEKIMQPFFTTKPTGEGTGLGLSLTYDMVVNGHGGRIALNTKEGLFTEFIVEIPL